jgi:hypothetical protein
MTASALVQGLKSLNLGTVRLACRDTALARAYLSECLRRYNELMGYGLRRKNALEYVCQQGWASWSADQRVELPIYPSGGGGTRPEELLFLATATRLLRPKRVFEIGTFNGQTTAVFILNAAPGASVLSLDLPPDVEVPTPTAAAQIDSDLELIGTRKLASWIHRLGLDSRYEQLLGDSLTFDPAPYAGSVELGFIDGAHSQPYVENDTRKMALMMSERGLVFWHDYGGHGRFADLTRYLDRLARRVPLFRVPRTSLAWAPAQSLKAVLA